MNHVMELNEQYAVARRAEDLRLAAAETIRISPWNPRLTMQRDIDRCERRIADLRRFTETWWRARGYRVVWNDDGEGYQLPSANVEPIESTGPS